LVERYSKTIEKHLRKFVASQQRDWNARLPIFLLVYRAFIHDTAGLITAVQCSDSLRPAVWGTPEKERPIIDHASNLLDLPHDIHNYARQNLKLTSDWMKIRHDRLANCAGYHEGDDLWLYRPTGMKGN
jgi:hypothetical protein